MEIYPNQGVFKMSSLDYLRGERKIKIKQNTDRRMLSTKILDLNEQTTLERIKEITFRHIQHQTKNLIVKTNKDVTAQELLNVC
jgi:hypothetical protein